MYYESDVLHGQRTKNIQPNQEMSFFSVSGQITFIT